MAEEYNINWDVPDYGYDWMTPEEETPFDFGTDWGYDMGKGDYDSDIDWGNFDFEEEWGAPSLTWEDPNTWGDYNINMNAPDYDYGNMMDEGWADWAGTQNWSDTPSLRELLGEEIDYGSRLDPNDPMYEYNLGLLGDDRYGIGSGMDQYYGDEYGDAWRSPWAQGDDPLAGFNFDAEGNLAPYDYGIESLFPGVGDTSSEDQSLMDIMNAYGINPSQATTQIQPSAEGRFPAIRSAFQSMLGLGPAGPNRAGVTGRRRPQSPFAGGLGVTPEWLKRIGDRIGLGGRSGLQDAYTNGYPEDTGQGIFGGDGLGSLFGGDGDGGGMGKWMMPLGLGILAAQATKKDRGVDLTPSVTMDPLGRYTLSGAGPEERREFGLGEIPTSLDFSAYEDIMGGS